MNWKTTISTLFTLFSIHFVFTQTCLPNGIVFETQAQIDAFTTDYPGCTEIEGFIIIEETTKGDITNLQGLGNLVSIGRYFDIRNNIALVNLYGLEQLESIKEGLNIFSNPSLRGLDGLEVLHTIGTNLFISQNNTLTNIKALDGLSSLGSDLFIGGSHSLGQFIRA